MNAMRDEGLCLQGSMGCIVFQGSMGCIVFQGSMGCTVFQGSMGCITCIAWKGETLVLGDVDGNLNLWELKARVSRYNSNNNKISFQAETAHINTYRVHTVLQAQ